MYELEKYNTLRNYSITGYKLDRKKLSVLNQMKVINTISPETDTDTFLRKP